MAAEEDQPQHVVLDEVDRSDEVGLVDLDERLAEVLRAPTQGLGPPEVVDRPALGDRHQPGPWLPRHPFRRPLLEGGDQCVLREVLGQTDVVSQPSEAADQPRGLQAPHGVHRGRRVALHRPILGDAMPAVPGFGSRGQHRAQDRSGGPSSGVAIRRTSTEPSQPGQKSRWISITRRAPATASSCERASRTAKPPATSFASAYGPSVTTTRPPVNRTSVLWAVGYRPPASRMDPSANAASSATPIASTSSGGGFPT